MLVPTTYLRVIESREFFPQDAALAHYQVLPNGHWIGGIPERALIYPPIGFLPWPFCEIGNGDVYGFYWPVGRENEHPVVCVISHDCWALNPIACSMEALAQQGRCGELCQLLDIEREEGCLDVATRLERDGRSPFLLVANADEALGRNELDRAESLYLRAVKELPEYTAAHYGLVVLYRRMRQPQQAVHWMLATIRSPLCFRGASFWAEEFLPLEHVNRNDFHRKCLHWLRQGQPLAGQGSDDPLFRARNRLTFASGVTTNEDYLIYDEAIEEYVRQGRAIEAIHLAMRVGELMMGETTPFRERYGFTIATHKLRLLRLFQEAGLKGRAQLLE